jgi:hypothetical protein
MNIMWSINRLFAGQAALVPLLANNKHEYE